MDLIDKNMHNATHYNNKLKKNEYEKKIKILENQDNKLSENILENNNKNSEMIKCPEVKIKIGEIELKSLIDAGSEVTCISAS